MSDVKTRIAELEAKTKEIGNLIKQFNENVIKEIVPLIQDFIKENNLEAVAWSQYSPYFNDGDPCTFSINEIYYVKSGIEEHGIPYKAWQFEDGNYELVTLYGDSEDKDLVDLCKSITDVINLNEDAFEYEYDDGVTVVITKDDVQVEECEHD